MKRVKRIGDVINIRRMQWKFEKWLQIKRYVDEKIELFMDTRKFSLNVKQPKTSSEEE